MTKACRFAVGFALVLVLVAGCSSSAAPESAEVLVPAGEAIVGANCIADDVENNVEASCDSSPRNRRTTVRIGAFVVDRNLVERADYLQCVKAGPCIDDGVPSTNYQRAFDRATRLVDYDNTKARVRYEHAAAYCQWRGARLLTPDEFERLARGTDGRVTPWAHGRNPCPPGRDVGLACVTAKGPAGVREIAYNPQWVDGRDKRYPAGMIRGSNDVTFWADNQDMSVYDERWQPTLYAAFRCARSVAPAAAAPPMPADATAAPGPARDPR